jgi:hypothetical protein
MGEVFALFADLAGASHYQVSNRIADSIRRNVLDRMN